MVGVSRGGTFETYTMAPNKALTIINAHPLGTIKVREDLYGVLSLKSNYAKFILQGKSKIGYRDVYVIDLQPARGTWDRLYVDAESYLPVRMNTTRIQEGASVPVEIYFDDWREVEGMKVPYSMTQSLPKMTMTLTVKEIQNNVPVDAKIFGRPL